MESYMDWQMIYRDETSMTSLMDGIECRAIASTNLFRDEERNVVFLEVLRQ